MVSTRRSGFLPGNNITTMPNDSSKRSEEDKPPSPKRQKLEDDDQTIAEETSKETNTLTPADSGECGMLGDTASISVDAKIEDSTTPPPPPPVAKGSTPTLLEKRIAYFARWNKLQDCSKCEKPWCKLLSQSGKITPDEQCIFLQDHKKSERRKRRSSFRDHRKHWTCAANGTVVKKNSSHVLHPGDEVVFGSPKNYAFIFQQGFEVAVKAGGLQIPAEKFPQLERKARDSSGVSVLASLASFRKDLSRRKSSSHASSQTCQAPEKPDTSEVHDGAELEIDGMEGKFPVNNQSDKAADSGVVSSHNQDSEMEFLDEKNELARNSLQASKSGNDVRYEIFKEDIQACIVEGERLEISFENFPYYLSENTKNVLIAASHIYLKQKEYAKHASDFTTLNSRILLSGPAGSEIYQEMLAKALANYFKAKLLVFDSRPILGTLTANIIKSLKHRIELIDRGKRSDWSAGEGDASSPSPASSSGPVSQPKMEPETLPRSFGTPLNHILKKGDSVRYCGAELYKGTTLRGPRHGSKGKVILVFNENPSAKVGVRFDKPIPDGVDLGELCEMGHGFFCNDTDLRFESSGSEGLEKLLINTMFEVVHAESRTCPFILFLKDAEKFVVGNSDSYSAFKNGLEYLPENIIVIGSQIHSDDHKEKSHPGDLFFTKFGSSQNALPDMAFPDIGRLHERGKEVLMATKLLTKLFENKVTIHMPQDEDLLTSWKHQLDIDAETLKVKANFLHLRMVLGKCGMECEEIETLCMKDLTLQSDSAEKIIGWALADHLRRNPKADPDIRVILSRDSIESGIGILRNLLNESRSSKNPLKDIVTENEFEKRLLSDVIPLSDIGVTFDDIGALENVIGTLKELAMLPVQRPEPFCKGQITKPCKGILLFGPPGTGKTMLAKAVAKEAGANFISISMLSIASKRFGEGEKYVKAVFSLASKISPSVIFVDEVDSMLGRSDNPGEHEAMRKMKNEFMINWDGLRTKETERVLVLAATNRPTDLDEAVIRQFPRRLMVGLPDSPDRAKILKVILAEEDLSADLDIDGVASSMTNGYSGSDLMNLCVTAAYRPINEILEKEKNERDVALAEGKVPPALSQSSDIRAINMEDFRYAQKLVCKSVSSDYVNLAELQQWNELYGESASRMKESPSYFS